MAWPTNTVWPGSPAPLGATWDGKGVNFALFSAHADKVVLCLFDRRGERELRRVELPEVTNHVWHGYLPDARPGLLYGYRVYGPYDPANGHRFNPHKLLIDPYAKSLRGSIRWSDAVFGYRIGHTREDLSFDRRDSARGMPKCRVVDDAFTWGDERRPRRRWQETLIYELHVRGQTMRHPDVAVELRGTFEGLSSPAVIDHLVRLGVTAVELMPVHAFCDDRVLTDRGLRNYWGYNTLAYFAPEPRYLAGPDIAEFKTMVAWFHEAGIEVILDVVYNHTAEGNHLGPTLSFKGIDNASYYRLLPDDRRYYIDETGCGNTLDFSEPRVIQLVLDSLRYWVEVMHVDGFRFDLGTILAREPYGFDPRGGFLDAIAQDPVLSRVRLIAEPWDIGPGGYQLGNFPAGWAEWNDRYRDTVRGFWRGDEGMLPELGGRITGSSDLFETGGRRPFASVNFVASHDGFTLNDVVSYNEKHNEANGEGNMDGHNHNLSYNYGTEGPTHDPSINRTRSRQRRNLLATLLLSQGTPMLLAGDEFGRSQDGNNNAYCQDNETSWLDWSGIDAEGHDLLAFTTKLAALRRRHPVFRRPRFLHGNETGADGTPDIAWFSPDGPIVDDSHWHDPAARCLGLLLNGQAGRYTEPDGTETTDTAFLLLLNAADAAVPFKLPSIASGRGWRRVMDTAVPDLDEDDTRYADGSRVRLTPRSLVLFRRADRFARGESPWRA